MSETVKSPQSRGGRARAEKLSSEKRKDIASAGAQARWGRQLPVGLRRAVAEGELRIGDLIIPCAVLDDGTRVLSERGLGRAFGRKRGGRDWRDRASDGGGELPYFLTSKKLYPFIANDIGLVGYKRIPYRPMHGGVVAFGTSADLIPNICDVWLRAQDAGLLNRPQKPIAEKAKIILRGLAHTGITALVDEATGYQYVRDKDELQKILAAYISAELLPWAKRFPEEFYKEMFRLWNWPWPANTAGAPPGPRYAGKLTKMIVYDKLPPGVLEEIEKRNPPEDKWQRRDRNHQLLTSDIGQPHLEKQVAVVTNLMKVCDNASEFTTKFDRAFPGTFGNGLLSFMADLESPTKA